MTETYSRTEQWTYVLEEVAIATETQGYSAQPRITWECYSGPQCQARVVRTTNKVEAVAQEVDMHLVLCWASPGQPSLSTGAIEHPLRLHPRSHMSESTRARLQEPDPMHIHCERGFVVLSFLWPLTSASPTLERIRLQFDRPERAASFRRHFECELTTTHMSPSLRSAFIGRDAINVRPPQSPRRDPSPSPMLPSELHSHGVFCRRSPIKIEDSQSSLFATHICPRKDGTRTRPHIIPD